MRTWMVRSVGRVLAVSCVAGVFLTAPVSAQPMRPTQQQRSPFAQFAVSTAPVAVRVALDRASADQTVLCNAREPNRAPTAVIDVSAPLTDWTIEVVPHIGMLYVTSAAGQPPGGRPSPCVPTGTTLTMAAGRYAVWVLADYDEISDWRRDGGRDVTLVVRPAGTPTELLTVSSAPPADLPVEARIAEQWFPNLAVHEVGRPFDPLIGLGARFALLAHAPRTLWAYPAHDLTADEAHVVFPYATTSEDGEPPAVALPRAGEALLRISGSYGDFLAFDGTFYELTRAAQQTLRAAPTPGGAVLPTEPRSTWAPFEALASGELPPALATRVQAVLALLERANACRSASVTRFDSATSGVIISARQRASASRRLQGDRQGCNEHQAAERREALRADLLAARGAELARRYQELRAALAAH